MSVRVPERRRVKGALALAAGFAGSMALALSTPAPSLLSLPLAAGQSAGADIAQGASTTSGKTEIAEFTPKKGAPSSSSAGVVVMATPTPSGDIGIVESVNLKKPVTSIKLTPPQDGNAHAYQGLQPKVDHVEVVADGATVKLPFTVLPGVYQLTFTHPVHSILVRYLLSGVSRGAGTTGSVNASIVPIVQLPYSGVPVSYVVAANVTSIACPEVPPAQATSCGSQVGSLGMLSNLAANTSLVVITLDQSGSGDTGSTSTQPADGTGGSTPTDTGTTPATTDPSTTDSGTTPPTDPTTTDPTTPPTTDPSTTDTGTTPPTGDPSSTDTSTSLPTDTSTTGIGPEQAPSDPPTDAPTDPPTTTTPPGPEKAGDESRVAPSETPSDTPSDSSTDSTDGSTATALPTPVSTTSTDPTAS